MTWQFIARHRHTTATRPPPVVCLWRAVFHRAPLSRHRYGLRRPDGMLLALHMPRTRAGRKHEIRAAIRGGGGLEVDPCRLGAVWSLSCGYRLGRPTHSHTLSNCHFLWCLCGGSDLESLIFHLRSLDSCLGSVVMIGHGLLACQGWFLGVGAVLRDHLRKSDCR